MINKETVRQYSWDDTRVQYYDNNRRLYVSHKTEYDILFKRIDDGGSALYAYVISVLESPEQDLSLLASFLRQELKSMHIQAAMLGRGGRGMMTPSDWGKIGNILKGQYAFINVLLDDLYYGTVTASQLTTRLHAYANKISYTFHVMRHKANKLAGRIEYMRIINSRESCGTCPSKAYKWGDLETLEWGLPADGGDACLSYCKCTVEYR